MNGFRATIGALVLYMTSCAQYMQRILLAFEVFGFGEWTTRTRVQSVNFHWSGLIGWSRNGKRCVDGIGSDRRSVHGLRNNWGRNSGGVNGRSRSRNRSREHLSDECGGSGLG